MSTGLILLAIAIIVAFLAVLEKHLERISEVGGRLAEEIKDRLIKRTLAVFITVAIIFAFSELTGINMTTEIIASLIGAFSIAIATVIENELELRNVI